MTYPIDQSHTSPNHGARGRARISMLVLHATVGSFKSALSWLMNPKSKVSSHYLIRKDGYIAQLVPDTRVAWHAGKSVWHGMDSDAIALQSIGIELENKSDGRDIYPATQLAAAHWLCQTLISRYNIERADVVRHFDIAIPRGRKTDPAGFPWPLFADSLFMDLGDNPRPSHPGTTHYRVKDGVTLGATIRTAPRTNAAVLGRLKAGDDWRGALVQGQLVFVKGFGSSNMWARSDDARFVWSGLLEQVKES